MSTHLALTFANHLVIKFLDEVLSVDELGLGPDPDLVRLQIGHLNENFFRLFVAGVVVRSFWTKKIMKYKL